MEKKLLIHLMRHTVDKTCVKHAATVRAVCSCAHVLGKDLGECAVNRTNVVHIFYLHGPKLRCCCLFMIRYTKETSKGKNSVSAFLSGEVALWGVKPFGRQVAASSFPTSGRFGVSIKSLFLL